VERKKKHCLNPECGWEWYSYIERPRQCPHCLAYDWDKPNRDKKKRRKK